jgi:SlyX protein
VSPDPRLDRIEERIAWLERHIVQQDKAMLEMAQENERLRQQLQLLRLKVGEGASSSSGEASSPSNDRPPHY